MSSSRSRIVTYRAIGDTTDPINPAAVSGNMSVSITGPTTKLDMIDQIAYQVAWESSDAVGVISVQGSVDNVTFYDLTFDPVLAQPDSDNGGYLIDLTWIPFMYIRLKYTKTSGEGTLTATMSAKGV